jgi:cytidine deaminase
MSENKMKLVAEFLQYDSAEELNATDLSLVTAARESAADAYAPYSEFHVGAALLLDNGIIVRGNNQENASYTLGLCAERVALFAAGANHPGNKIVAMAITAASAHFKIDRAIAPCGACRQAIAEYEQRYRQPIRLIMTGVSGQVLVADSISPLLPLQFSKDDLMQ